MIVKEYINGILTERIETQEEEAARLSAESLPEAPVNRLNAEEMAARLEALSAEQTELREALELLLSGVTE